MCAKSYLEWFAVCALTAGAGLAQAASVSTPQGCYGMDGKISVALKIPNILNLSLSSPHMSAIGLNSRFDQDQGFVLRFPVLSSLAGGLGGSLALPSELNGTWKVVRGSAFSVQTELLDMIGQLQELGLQAQVTGNSFTGVASNNGENLRGAFDLGLSVSLAEAGQATLAIKGTYTGTAEECDAGETFAAKTPAFQAGPNVGSGGEARAHPGVTEFTVNFLKNAMDETGTVRTDALRESIRKFLAGQ